MSDWPETTSARPIWLMTLADLALLLVGFFVLLQATQAGDRRALIQELQRRFGVIATSPMPAPVAADGVNGFAPGSATIGQDTGGLVAWARQALADPRVSLTVTGSTDGSTADVDPSTGSAALLAADRARAVAAVLAPVARGRLVIATSRGPGSRGRRAVLVTLAFAGEKGKQP